MSEMIERVARAMGDVADKHAAGEGCDDVGVLDADLLLDLAAEAIEAMREPTNQMIDAGGHAAPPDGPYADGPAWIRNRWQAMIGAALKSHAKQI